MHVSPSSVFFFLHFSHLFHAVGLLDQTDFTPMTPMPFVAIHGHMRMICAGTWTDCKLQRNKLLQLLQLPNAKSVWEVHMGAQLCQGWEALVLAAMARREFPDMGAPLCQGWEALVVSVMARRKVPVGPRLERRLEGVHHSHDTVTKWGGGIMQNRSGGAPARLRHRLERLRLRHCTNPNRTMVANHPKPAAVC